MPTSIQPCQKCVLGLFYVLQRLNNSCAIYAIYTVVVYDESVCWHAPVSKDTKTDTICMMQSKKQAYNKKKRHFGHLWLFWGCCSYPAVLVRIPRLLCMMNQYVGMIQFQKILRPTQFVGCRAKNRHTTRKKGILVIYGYFGVVVATIW